MTSGHAKLRVMNKDGVTLCETIMTHRTLKIGRESSDAVPLEKEMSWQDFKVPTELTGVSRDHVCITWSELDMGFKLTVTGRNGAIVNRKKLNQGESSILYTKTVSALALGKTCFIYFAPATSKLPKSASVLPSPKAKDNEEKRAPMKWLPAILSEFQARETKQMSLNDIYSYIESKHSDHCESVTSWRKTVKQVVKRAPFVLEESTQIVTLS